MYNQYSKKIVRHSAILQAVEFLTTKRGQSCCVKRNYVRKVRDYYTFSEDDSKNKIEAKKIDISYITNWESLHDSYVGSKKPEDLTVCYLSGPEPDNDFQEFISLGVLPQNIWALESNNATYKKAVSAYNNGKFPQPRILKQNIETFFEQTPKKFDIIYIDACGSVPSSQHALRCISTICLNNRLNSPGIIISNFSKPDTEKESIKEFYEIVSQYLLFKEYPLLEVKVDGNGICNNEYTTIYDNVKENFEYYYGEFISAVLRDIPSIIIPIERIAQNPYLNQLFDLSEINSIDDLELIKLSKGHSLAKYIFTVHHLSSKNILGEKSQCFLKEIGNYDNLLMGLKIIILLKREKLKLKDDVVKIKDYFEENNRLYQFLDKPHSNLIFDMLINQLAYPLHYNIPQNTRYQYTAKSNLMFTDITIYDECRYIYEWLPAMHQIVSAFDNVSWQYVFRFALDGLVKMRQNYNNEFFFQSSVVSNTVEGFSQKELKSRIVIE
ncbi:hypothetical protein [Clostridium sp.]|uniref:hypothetical protein n=1 Tax=Clostridium sp. TaxID=1506 RepID=UPI00321718DF